MEDVVEAFTKLSGGDPKYITPDKLSQYFTDTDLQKYLLSVMPKAADGSGNLDFEAFTKMMYETGTNLSDVPIDSEGIAKGSSRENPESKGTSRLDRAGHRRNMTQRAAGTLKDKRSFLDSAEEQTQASTSAVQKGKKNKPRRQSWVKATTDNGETYYYDDPKLGGTGITQWDSPKGADIAGEYIRVEEQEIDHTEERTRTNEVDGSAVYNSNTGKSQAEPPQGFEEAMVAKESSNKQDDDQVTNVSDNNKATKTAKALYPYEATGDNQTTIQEGEVVVILEPDAGGWTGVESAAGAGYVPTSYLQV